MKTLGVDCGNVILYHYVGIVPDAFESLQAIVQSGHFENVYIVSRASLIGRAYFLLRLRRLDFWEKTGVSRKNIYFCRKDSQKITICKKLGITDFIDDRLPVLEHMESLGRDLHSAPNEGISGNIPRCLRKRRRSSRGISLALLCPPLLVPVCKTTKNYSVPLISL